jgi:serine protease Do
LVALVLLGLLALPLRAQSAKPTPGMDLLHQLDSSVESLTQRVSPAVVQILVMGYAAVEEHGRTDTALIGRQHSLGSGVIVDPDGYIMTNAHMVEGAERVRVVLLSADATGSPSQALGARTTTLNARILGVNKDTDLALLKVEASGLASLPFGRYADVRQGQLVFAFGSPEGLGNSVTMGVISSVARQPDPERPMVYIQTDAPINPGNSGGPLVDIEGRLVGINTFILTAGGGNEGIGFAIPSTMVHYVYEQLRDHGHVHRGAIGASVQDITPTLAAGLGLPRDQGLVVSDVIPDGPAEGAGLKIGDIILTLNGRAVTSMPQFEAGFMLRVNPAPLKVEALRGSEKVLLEIPVVEHRDEMDQLADALDPRENLVPKLGILGIQIDRRISDMIPGLRISSGVIVAARTTWAASMELGLMTGDVIHSLNGVSIISLEALRSGILRLQPGDATVLQIERDGKLQYLASEME